MRLRLIPATLLAIGPLAADDGGPLYQTYCSACHAPDGEGATGGQFPPLAKSEWLQGDPDRAIKIVLKGLQGPVEVRGREFNLMMPPQGDALSDDHIAAILTHVRSSWGNRGEEVLPAGVAAIRKSLEKRTTPWTADELLKLHPLPREESALRNLTSSIYHGSWKSLPDFEKLEARNIEEEHDGLISLADADRKDHFGLVWKGDFVAEKDGMYQFRLVCDDGGRVVIDDKEVLKVDGLGPASAGRAKEGRLRLAAGAHPIRIEYFEATGMEDISLAWRSGGKEPWRYLSESRAGTTPQRSGPPPIPVEPTPDRAAIYRNFIAGTTPRAIGIGLPGAVNFAYSADHLAPELLWTGSFMDAGRHWNGRGQGAQQPAGDQVIKLTGSPALPGEARFRGYKLDPAGNPTFMVTLPGGAIEDSYRASGSSLVRKLGHTGTEAASVVIAENLPIESTADGWRLASVVDLRIAGGHAGSDGNKLLLTIPPGDSATLTYTWR